MIVKLLLPVFLLGFHMQPLYADYPAGFDMTLCGSDSMVCTDGSTPWDEGALKCCPYGDAAAFCCRKDNPFVCFVKQMARHIEIQAPKHYPCCYNCPMGEGGYYGIGHNSEASSDESFSIHEKYREEDSKKKVEIHSASHEHIPDESHDHNSHRDIDTMRADAEESSNRPVPEAPTTTATPRPQAQGVLPAGPILPMLGGPIIPLPTFAPVFRAEAEADTNVAAFETCKMKRLATYYIDEDTVCCVGGATSQCCLKDRIESCSTDMFGVTQPIKGLNRDVLSSVDFSPDCAIRRIPTTVTAYLRQVQLHTPLAGAMVTVGQVEGCDVRVLMNINTIGLPAGYDYAFEIGNKTVCGDSNDVSELLVTLPVNMRHERFKVPSSLSSVRDLRGNSLSVIRMDANGQSQMLACGRFL